MASDEGISAVLCKKQTVIGGWLAIALGFIDNAPALRLSEAVNGGPVGSPAMLICEFGQVRKEAAVTNDACAGM